MKEELVQQLSSSLKAIRISKGLTQDEASKLLDLSVNHYAKLERGESTPTIQLLCDIAEKFDLDLNIDLVAR